MRMCVQVRVLNKRLEPEINIFFHCDNHRLGISLKMDIHRHAATAIAKIENGPKVLQVDDNFAGVHDPIDVKFFDWYGEHCFTPKNVQNSRFIIMFNSMGIFI